jgi:hypothetical protein
VPECTRFVRTNRADEDQTFLGGVGRSKRRLAGHPLGHIATAPTSRMPGQVPTTRGLERIPAGYAPNTR